MGQYTYGKPITLSYLFTDAGTAFDPDEVIIKVRDPDDALYTYTSEITNPSVGRYELDLGAPVVAGHYNYRVEGYVAGEIIDAAEGDFDVLSSPTLTITLQGIEHGPCTTWLDGADVADCCNAEVGSDTSLLDGAALAASQLLYEASGRIYAGTCEKTVRPCSRRVWCGQVLSRGHIVGWSGNYWNWWNEREYHRACGCRPLDRVWLSGYPVTSITEVLIDGDVVDPNTYRLDEHRFLSRTRDPADPATILYWPSCQNLDLPDTEDGTFSVTYEYGANPPLIGTEAAKQLACQIYLACTNSGECQLPSGATRVTRQGITIERTFFARDPATGAWRTGLNLVDLFLNTVNPGGVKRRPAFWSPDGPRYARPVGDWVPSS